MNMSNKTA